MDGEIPTSIMIGTESVPIETSSIEILEQETKVRLNGVFRVGSGYDNGKVVVGILKAFGLFDILIKKGWSDERGHCIVSELKKSSLGNNENGVYKVDFTIGTQI